MDPVNILVVVISCKKHKHLWPEILNRGIDNLIIVCGSAEESIIDNKILNLACPDTYEGLSEKMMAAYEFLLKSETFLLITHILKVDDHDTLFSSKEITDLSSKYKKVLQTNDYIGQTLFDKPGNRAYHFGKVSKDSIWHNTKYTGEYNPWLSGGASYILSRRAMEYVCKNKSEMYKYGAYEDLMVGNILCKNKIFPYKLNYGIKTWNG